MPQEFHVVRCFSCEAFQSQQVKKVNKFVCKLCGSKQSVRKEYGRGSGKDCRVHVQKLNNLRGEIEEKEEVLLESKLQDDGEMINEYYGQEYYGSGQYGGEEHFIDDDQYNNFQHESVFSEELSSAVKVGSSNINNQHTKESKKSKWTSYLSDETGEEDEFTEMHGQFNPEKEGEHYAGSQHTFENGWQKNRLAMNKPKKVKRDEGHPYQHSTAKLTKSPNNVNFAESDKEIFLRKYNEYHAKVPVNSSTQIKTNFDQNYVACPSNTGSEKKTQILSLKENIQYKKETSRSMGGSTEGKMSTNNIGSCFSAEYNAVYKEISHPSDPSFLLESKPQTSLSIDKYTKPTFMAKVKGTQNIYNKFADAHELEDIL